VTGRQAVQHDPWAHRESGWSGSIAAQSETLLALSNGYLGLRGTLDEGAPAAAPGTYLNGFHETPRMAYADRGAGDPTTDQVLVGVTDGTRIRLVVEGETLDIRTGTVLEHERAVDLRAGLLVRTLRWRSPAGHEITLRTRRVVSLTHRELAAIEYEVEATTPLHVTVHSEMAVDAVEAGASDDPRSGAELPTELLTPQMATHDETRAVLVHQTRVSNHVVAAGMDHILKSSASQDTTISADGSSARWSSNSQVGPGRP
jgi:alpha,alpha-trehalose phosphorylase